MLNGILNSHEKHQNQIIFWLSFIPICLNGVVTYATLRPSKPWTKKLRSPTFQMLGFFTLSCLFTSFFSLMIPTGLWGFYGNLSPQFQKIISVLSAFFGWYQSIVFLTILAIIRFITAISPVWWHSVSHHPNIKKRSITFGICVFICNAMVFGLSNTLTCDFLPNELLVIIPKCESWMYFGSIAEIVLLATSAACSIIAIVVFKCKNQQELGVAQKHRVCRLIIISFTEWLFAAIIHGFYREYMLRKSPEALGEAAYLLYWVFPKYAILAHVCLSNIIYLWLSSELREAVMIMFGLKPITINIQIDPSSMGRNDIRVPSMMDRNDIRVPSTMSRNDLRLPSMNDGRIKLQPIEAITQF